MFRLSAEKEIARRGDTRVVSPENGVASEEHRPSRGGGGGVFLSSRGQDILLLHSELTANLRNGHYNV